MTTIGVKVCFISRPNAAPLLRELHQPLSRTVRSCMMFFIGVGSLSTGVALICIVKNAYRDIGIALTVIGGILISAAFYCLSASDDADDGASEVATLNTAMSDVESNCGSTTSFYVPPPPTASSSLGSSGYHSRCTSSSTVSASQISTSLAST